MDYVEGVSDEMPKLVSLSEYKDNPPELPEELIKGILRRGHKMLLSGSSKAGKSFLLMELCICIAEGKPWLGFDCKRGKVLYVNLEIDPDSAINRFLKIYEAMGIPMEHTEDIVIWNLRGHAVPLDQLVPKLIRRIKDQTFVAIVIVLIRTLDDATPVRLNDGVSDQTRCIQADYPQLLMQFI